MEVTQETQDAIVAARCDFLVAVYRIRMRQVGRLMVAAGVSPGAVYVIQSASVVSAEEPKTGHEATSVYVDEKSTAEFLADSLAKFNELAAAGELCEPLADDPEPDESNRARPRDSGSRKHHIQRADSPWKNWAAWFG